MQALLKNPTDLKCVALGSSSGTGSRGITAQVVEVSSFEELEKLGSNNLSGKVVFYNVFFDQTHINPGMLTAKLENSGLQGRARLAGTVQWPCW